MSHGYIKGLYYITHVDNLPSILKLGILSHKRVEEENIKYTPIYDAEIVANRRQKQTPDGRSLWSFANLYFQPRNPMLYRVLSEKSPESIAIVNVKPSILERSDYISDGNAASSMSDILLAPDGLKVISEMRRLLNSDWWTETDGSKRKIMAECLVPNEVQPQYIQTIYVASQSIAQEIKNQISEKVQGCNIPVIPEPQMFFQPSKQSNISPSLSIVQGDMFFSKMQTLTVSVNIVGIMGKGLASTAKYRFPDVYVLYQDLCRNRILQMGKPYLYKRESSFDSQLADEPSPLSNANSQTWFLLFPTKRHWKENSDINAIEKGLRWIQDNYRKEGIKSLAVPALGCGLGRLEWRGVGPLLCRHLSTLNIPVQIYLPAEKEISEDLLSKEFLLR
jgi:hypothetical protein